MPQQNQETSQDQLQEQQAKKGILKEEWTRLTLLPLSFILLLIGQTIGSLAVIGIGIWRDGVRTRETQAIIESVNQNQQATIKLLETVAQEQRSVITELRSRVEKVERENEALFYLGTQTNINLVKLGLDPIPLKRQSLQEGQKGN